MNNISWRISGTAVQGLCHLNENIPCQDKIFSLIENGVTAIALADGAGSAVMSHYGADLVVKTICQKLCSDFNQFINTENSDEVRKILLETILYRLSSLASKLDCKINDLASTLLAVASDGENILIVHIGDGIICCFKDGKMLPASLPDNGEFKNETFFVTSPYIFHRMRLSKGKIAGISGIVLMSDGTDEVFYDRQEKKFASLLNEIKQNCMIYPEDKNNMALEELFCNTVRYHTHDDCSLIIMCRPDEYFRGYRDLDVNTQNYFLCAKDVEGRENREKVFSIFSGNESMSHRSIIKSACKLGLKRKQTCGLIRDLCKNGFIECVKIFPRRRYKIKFCY